MESHPWSELQSHYESEIKPNHLRELLQDEQRNDTLKVEFDNIILDYSHVKMTSKTLKLLEDFVEKTHLFDQIESMFRGVLNIYNFFLKKNLRIKSINQKIVLFYM